MTGPPNSKNDVPLESSIPEAGASLESILCTEELQRRPSRPPDFEREIRALVKLMSALADSPKTILQTLAETILEVTRSDSAGVSLLTEDDGGKRFYWPAIAGIWKPHIGGGTPRNFGPCGDVLDRNCTLLFRHLERRYTYFLPVVPQPVETLLVPFYVGKKAVGTIWALIHDDCRKFDAEDSRVMDSLGKFAASAHQALVHTEDLKIQVAERQKAEAEVRELAKDLEAKVRRLVGANVVGIVMWNLEGAITGANEAFLRMVQYGREDIDSGRVLWTDLTPAEWRAHDERALADLKSIGIFQPFEKEYFRRDGSRVPVLIGGALFEASGNEGVAFVLDLSEQKRAQEQLRESEARLQAIFENTPSLIFLKDPQGRYLSVNKEFKRAYGVAEDQVRGMKDDELFSAEQAAAFQDNDRQVLAARIPMEFEEVALQEDGQHTSIVQKFPLFDTEGEIYAIGGIATDITQRKKEDSARRYSEERHRVVVEMATDAVVSADDGGVIQFANPAVMRVFGYDPKDLIGKPLTLLMPEFMRELHQKGFRRYLATGQRHINWQGAVLTGLRKNGQEFPVEVSFGELTLNGRQIFTGFIRDITERKQAEKERERLRQVQADLAHVARVSTMGELTASLAHEINQPIGAAVTNAQACLRFLDRSQHDVREAREAALETIRDATRAADIIDRVRSLYRKSSPHEELVDVNEVIREMVVMLREEAIRHSVDVRSELREDLPNVVADRVQLQQVLMNLMMNGMEAMRDAGGELNIKSQFADDGQLLISVSDTGVGLPTGKDSEIFKPFFTTKSHGTGLGLAITRSIVESHGGRIWATANSGGGTIFQLTLPQIRAAHA